MAKITGVKTHSDCEIEYEGVRYAETEGPAQLGDIVRSDSQVCRYLPHGAFYTVEDDYYGLHIADEDGDHHYDVDDDDDYTIFRRVESAPQTPQSPAEIRALIEQKRAEITELEAQLEIRINDFVRVSGRSYDEEFTTGDVAKVAYYNTESADTYPVKLESIVGSTTDWARETDVVKISAAEAKAALIAQIEEAFAETPQSA